jgi:hypothetical protein
MLSPDDSGLNCERFMRLNAHLAGNFKSRELKGATASALVRSRQRIAAEAKAQGDLLPPEIFKKADGTKMGDAEVNRCMVLIRTVDRCLGLPSRLQAQFANGLVADASAVAEKFEQEEIRKFYVWLSTHRESVVVPKRTELVVAQWTQLLALSKTNP